MRICQCYPALLLLFLLPQYLCAQSEPAWPRHATTKKVEFTGLLPWPMALTTPDKQALMQRWYWKKLSGRDSTRLGEANTPTMLAKLPDWGHLDTLKRASTGDPLDNVAYRLLYTVQLTPTAAGLRYRLTGLECVEIVFDASNRSPLEEVIIQLPKLPKEQRQFQQDLLAAFHRRLRAALSAW